MIKKVRKRKKKDDFLRESLFYKGEVKLNKFLGDIYQVDDDDLQIKEFIKEKAGKAEKIELWKKQNDIKVYYSFKTTEENKTGEIISQEINENLNSLFFDIKYECSYLNLSVDEYRKKHDFTEIAIYETSKGTRKSRPLNYKGDLVNFINSLKEWDKTVLIIFERVKANLWNYKAYFSPFFCFEGAIKGNSNEIFNNLARGIIKAIKASREPLEPIRIYKADFNIDEEETKKKTKKNTEQNKTTPELAKIQQSKKEQEHIKHYIFNEFIPTRI